MISGIRISIKDGQIAGTKGQNVISSKDNFGEVFDEVVNRFSVMKDSNGRAVNVYSIMATTSKGETFEHYFRGKGSLQELRSLSKPIVGLALGIAIEKGLIIGNEKLTLETPVWPYLKRLVNLTNIANLPRLDNLKLKHLLTHTIGQAKGLMFSKDITNIPPGELLDYILNSDLISEPGKLFVYSNAGPFLISVIIQEELGINLSAWISDILFKPMEIEKFEWKNYGKYCAGSTGLKLYHEDLQKIACLFLKDGKYGYERIVPKHWIDEMRSPQVRLQVPKDKPTVLRKSYYGYYLWIGDDGTYFADGTNGQYLILPSKRRVAITVLSDQDDTRPITKCMEPFLR
ncbi:MAG: serine hydrolase [Thermoplasmatales archaeon]|nr:serine hydrolase [Thermoplasmatales archaeon]